MYYIYYLHVYYIPLPKTCVLRRQPSSFSSVLPSLHCSGQHFSEPHNGVPFPPKATAASVLLLRSMRVMMGMIVSVAPVELEGLLGYLGGNDTMKYTPEHIERERRE